MSLRELVLSICGGNPGCIRVLSELAATKLDRLIKLRDLGYRGPFIWLIYKDLLGGDLEKMKKLLDSNQLADEIERRIQEDENFARQWRYHEENYP